MMVPDAAACALPAKRGTRTSLALRVLFKKQSEEQQLGKFVALVQTGRNKFRLTSGYDASLEYGERRTSLLHVIGA